MKRTRRSKRLRRNDRGSALLVSLMVIVGLSLLGLGFVAISETETAIAKNQLSVMQTQAIAEAGAKLVVEWFQDPSWGESYGALPLNTNANPNLAAIKVKRVVPNAGGVGVTYTGYYKPDPTKKLFDKPYRPDAEHRFYGDENTGDIVINRTTDKTTIDTLNKILLGPSSEDLRDGEITEVRVYAPPLVGATLTPEPGGAKNPDGTPQAFWTGGERYGVATIKVTATMFRDRTVADPNKMKASNILATHSIRLVVGEIPLPIPAGPIQGNANVAFGGNFQVHWGMETSTGTLEMSKLWAALPWANAFERPHFEHGYEPGTSIASVLVVGGGAGYSTAPTVNIPAPTLAGGVQATATATIAGGAVTSVTLTNRGKGYAQYAAFPPQVTFTGGGGAGAVAAAIVSTEIWPITGGQFEDHDYFHEIVGKTFDDPWYGARAIGDNTIDGATTYPNSPQAYTYAYDSDETSSSLPTYAFQWQDVNQWPWQKKVVFPTIKYDFWKKVAKTGKGYKGIYYFNYAGNGTFELNNKAGAKPMSYWANSLPTGSNLGPGFYFFDTVNSHNPQALTGQARIDELTPDEAWSTNDFGSDFLMEGFVYMNANSFGTKGQGKAPTQVDANFPGEPFRDIGYPQWDPSTNNWVQCPVGSGIPCRQGAGDAVFSYQDLNGNGKFDVVVMDSGAYQSHEGGANVNQGATYVPKTWKSQVQATADYGAPCTVPAAGYDGTNPGPNDCSEPHEPYINLQYPDNAMDNNNHPFPVIAAWQKPSAQDYKPKKKGVTCTASSKLEECTSNAYDVDGAMVPLSVILYGIMYNEGAYNAEGNAVYYGSVLIQDNIVKGVGTADVFFDEKLIKGSWAPPKMPRVIVYNEQTDEEQQ